MADLIDRQAAIDAITNCEPGEEVFMLENMPSAQPEIIRCKDCKYCDKRPGVHDCHNPVFGNGFGNYPPPSMRENDFCSRAERRTDERQT